MAKKVGKFDTGLFVGRFQPFHKGHMHALKIASRSCKKMIIGIGSAQEKGTDKNPLSAAARRKIIQAAIAGSAVGKMKPRFIAIPDFNDNEKWFGYITKKIPKVGVVFSRNKLVRKIFKIHRIPVVALTWYNRKKLSSTNVRRVIRNGGSWQNLVPRGAVSEIRARFKEAGLL